MQEGSEQRPHKVSYHVSVKGSEAEQLVQKVEQKLRDQGSSAKVIYSGGADLDILPQGASKGKGLEFLLAEVMCFAMRPQSYMDSLNGVLFIATR